MLHLLQVRVLSDCLVCTVSCCIADSGHAGAANSTILYDPSETWGLATVVTLCGVHQALPVAASQHRHTPQAGLRESVQAALAALQQYGLSWMAHLKASAFPSNSKHAASPELHKVVMDTRGMWADSLQATTWAYKNLFTACKQTHAMIAIQVWPGISSAWHLLLPISNCSQSVALRLVRTCGMSPSTIITAVALAAGVAHQEKLEQ